MKNVSAKKLTRASLVGIALLASACAHSTVGRQFDTTHARDVQRGQDRASVEAWFGQPTSTTVFMQDAQGCVERWQYTHAVGSSRGHAHAQVLIVDFDPSGLVCNTAYSEVDQ